MPVRSTIHPGGIEAMLRAPQMIGAMRVRAARVKRRAQEISNVDVRVYVDKHGNQHPGFYKRSWHYRSGIKNGRAYARVWNSAPYAGFLEFGTRYMRAYRVLGRAMASIRR